MFFSYSKILKSQMMDCTYNMHIQHIDVVVVDYIYNVTYEFRKVKFPITSSKKI